jgi:hypothetical protein
MAFVVVVQFADSDPVELASEETETMSSSCVSNSYDPENNPDAITQ